MASRLFTTDVGPLGWREFSANGFSRPVCGVVYRAGESVCGLPLGGLGTGCIDLNTDGLLGRASIFNSFTPPREIDQPFLAVSVQAKVWALTTAKLAGVDSVAQIHYFGHYPVADLEYDLDAPISVGLRAWSPFLPGCSLLSNTPGAVFEVHLRNMSDTVQQGRLAMTFPGATLAESRMPVFPVSPTESETPSYRHRNLDGPIRGVEVRTSAGIGFALAVVGDQAVQIGGSLGRNGAAWANMVRGLPGFAATDPGASLAVDFQLAAHEEKIVRLILSWYHPRWVGNEYHHYLHKYAERFTNAAEVAEFLAVEHEQLLRRILAWQEAIYAAEENPVWLREQLVNILHTLTEDSFWASNSIPREDWCIPDGMFGLTESPRTVPHVAMPSDWYGGLPLAMFFPDLAASLLRSYAHFQLPNGELPLGIGSGADLGSPIYHCLHTQNSAVYVDLVDRLWQCRGEHEVLSEFYPAVKKGIEYLMTLDRDGDGLLDLEPDPCGNQFYGAWAWYGTSPYVAGFWLAALAMATRMAQAIGDLAFANTCRADGDKGSRTLEKKLWNGQYYLLYNDPGTGRRSDTLLSNQLAGQWIAWLHGLPAVFSVDRAKHVLETVKRMAMPATTVGILNAVRPDGTIDPDNEQSREIFPGENMVIAMTMMYAGGQESGLEVARRVIDNLVLRQRVEWDMPNRVHPADGRVTYGTDFYQQMILWGLPSAIRRQTLKEFTAPGGLVDRVLRAAGGTTELEK
jgi:uncharacterized protein (DUF608 family)